MRDQGKRNMVCPKVVGQSGTARAAPVLVTRPPATIRSSVVPAVVAASRCGQSERAVMPERRSRPSVAPGPGARGRQPPVLRQVVLGHLRGAVLVGAAVDDGQRGAPVA